jgi:NAD(P)-dependent dehydrogenase (short-subunit alcohol dehydrogenase family)
MQYQNIAITGASSGLGHALAVGLAAPGVTLHLAGRDAARLAEAACACRAKDAQATETVLDVTDAPAMAAWLRGCPGLDLVIANAGISGGPGKGNREKPEQIRKVFATNVDGVFNTALPAMEMGVKRVVVISSIAGLIALPTSPAYSAAKAALNFWVRAATPGAARDGIGLTLVRPGFIRTPLTAKNPYTMPGLMDAGRAAAIIIAGIEAGRSTITFPWWLAAFARLGNLMPRSIFNGVPAKPEQA